MVLACLLAAASCGTTTGNHVIFCKLAYLPQCAMLPGQYSPCTSAAPPSPTCIVSASPTTGSPISPADVVMVMKQVEPRLKDKFTIEQIAELRKELSITDFSIYKAALQASGRKFSAAGSHDVTVAASAAAPAAIPAADLVASVVLTAALADSAGPMPVNATDGKLITSSAVSASACCCAAARMFCCQCTCEQQSVFA